MDYALIETKMKESYAAVAQVYRKNDEADASGPDHQRIAGILTSHCCSFRRPISVLDIGCGTGRYFHSLRNVRHLVGMDVSQEMLEEAKQPVRADELSIGETKLICDNFYTTDFPAGSFDFIYSLGVFGNGCALTVDLFNKFHRWLSRDGCLFLDTIDSMTAPWPIRLRRRAKHIVHEMLPRPLQNAWDRKNGWLPLFLTSKKHLEKMLERSRFPSFMVKTTSCVLPCGVGRKLECFASKNLAESSHALVT
jgi:SAM-dependent methyltransferase